MFNRRIGLAAMVAALAGGIGNGLDALTQRYGNSARNSKAAQQKRAARKLRNVRARASKRA